MAATNAFTIPRIGLHSPYIVGTGLAPVLMLLPLIRGKHALSTMQRIGLLLIWGKHALSTLQLIVLILLISGKHALSTMQLISPHHPYIVGTGLAPVLMLLLLIFRPDAAAADISP